MADGTIVKVQRHEQSAKRVSNLAHRAFSWWHNQNDQGADGSFGQSDRRPAVAGTGS
jgi:hypothetical protein